MRLKDITVEQFIKLSQIEQTFREDEDKMAVEIANLFHPKNSLRYKDAQNFYTELKMALLEEPRHIKRFTHKGIEYGFIPNLENISTGEYVDLDHYSKNKETYHKMLSVLYRPVIKSADKLYRIEEYDGTKYENVMKEVSCEILLGSIGFFFRLSEIMLTDLHTYLKMTVKKNRKTTD